MSFCMQSKILRHGSTVPISLPTGLSHPVMMRIYIDKGGEDLDSAIWSLQAFTAAKVRRTLAEQHQVGFVFAPYIIH